VIGELILVGLCVASTLAAVTAWAKVKVLEKQLADVEIQDANAQRLRIHLLYNRYLDI